MAPHYFTMPGTLFKLKFYFLRRLLAKDDEKTSEYLVWLIINNDLNKLGLSCAKLRLSWGKTGLARLKIKYQQLLFTGFIGITGLCNLNDLNVTFISLLVEMVEIAKMLK